MTRVFEPIMLFMLRFSRPSSVRVSVQLFSLWVALVMARPGVAASGQLVGPDHGSKGMAASTVADPGAGLDASADASAAAGPEPGPGAGLDASLDASAAAAPEPGPDAGPAARAGRLSLIPPRLFVAGVFYLPKATYTTDRGFGVGATAYYPFRIPGGDVSHPASSLHGSARVTHKRQARSEFDSIVNIGPIPWTLHFKISYSDLAERFYGVGPGTSADAKEVYRPQRLRSYLEVSRQLVDRASIGARLEYENVLLRDLEPAGELVARDLRGTRRSTVAGLGILTSWDARDDAHSPRGGFYAEGFYVPFLKSLGGGYDFENTNLDLRAYFPMPVHNALALQFFYYGVRGDPPFWRYASLGGREHTRGYRKDRYLDRVLIAFQGELRFRLGHRLGGVTFAGLGDVAPRLSSLELEHMKPTIGAGLRLRPGPSDSGTVVRFDVGLGGLVPRFYLAFGEAF